MLGQDKVLSGIDIKSTGPYLIIGPKGSGKTTLARKIIQKYICEYKTGCGTCIQCKTFLKDEYFDFHMLSGGKVDEVRNLIGKLSKKPYYFKHFVILDDIDNMTTEGQNSLLKILEEPATPILFVVTGTIRKNILKTILSRCNKISPLLLDDETILNELKVKYPDEDEEFLRMVSDYCNGSLGVAYNMIERKEFYAMLKEDTDKIQTKNFFEMANRYKDYKNDTNLIFEFYEHYLRNIMVQFNKEKKDTDNLFDIIQTMQEYKLQLKNNINQNIMYQNLILKIQNLFTK